MQPLLYLASRSPRRHALLKQIGLPHRLLDVEVDETPARAEGPEAYVIRLALEKARKGRAETVKRAPLPVLAADTAVVLDDKILGKPQDRRAGLNMLACLSGRTHRVCTGVALVGDGAAYRLNVSEVTFGPISDRDAAAYWASGEPRDKAGGYGIQGLGALFVRELRGSYSGVMGLPLYETAALLRRAGIVTPRLRSAGGR